METNQGFTFTRRAPNKAVDVECIKIDTSRKTKEAEVDDGFKYTKIGENRNVCKTNIKESSKKNTKNLKSIRNVKTTRKEDNTKKNVNDQEKGKPEKESNLKKAIFKKSISNLKGNKEITVKAINKTTKKNLVDKSLEKQGISQESNANNKVERKINSKVERKINNKVDQSVLEFNVIKKRKTIQLDKEIDISSNSILVEAPTGECMSESTIRMEIPVIGEKVKSHEIHKGMISNNINDLIKECIFFLKDESKYSKEVIKHCNANYFSDIDYRKEIEMTNGRVEQVKTEISKWKSIFEEEKDLNKIVVPELVKGESLMEASNEGVLSEFEGKARVLQVLDEKLSYFFENAKEKSENLLKSVFGSMEEKNMDALFLLKAMSRIGR